MSAEQPETPFPSRRNPVDPELSPDVGREKRRWLIPASIAIALAIVAVVWLVLVPHGPKPPELTFRSAEIGCTFTFSSKMSGGPNFVRSESGSVLTIERHSLFEAKKTFLAGLPDVLFDQVMIQINENYTDAQERSRRHLTVDGRKALQVILKGNTGSFKVPTIITITIFANEDWAYVVRSYWSENLDAVEKPLFERVIDTWKFIG